MTHEKVAVLDAADPKSEDRINAMIAEGWTVFSIDPIPDSTHAIAVLRWSRPRRPKGKEIANAPTAS